MPARTGAGGVFTTVEDLARWDRNFDDATVGGDALVRQITTPGRLASGRALEYAFGLEVREDRGLRVIEHGGDLVGYHAHFARYPERRLSMICLCNHAAIDARPLARAAADVFLSPR